MARKKCYWCEERHPEEFTTRTTAKTGGSYNRAPGHRPVRACYRCIAQKAWNSAQNYGTGPDVVDHDAHRDEQYRKRGWDPEALPPLGDVPYHNHHSYFVKLWPYEATWPAYPDAFPDRLLPPDEFRPEG